MSASDNPETGRVVSFPGGTEEHARRLRVEVERLAQLPTVEWMLYTADENYAAKYGVDKATLKRMVEAVIKEAEKKKRTELTEQRRIEDRTEKKQAADEKRRIADKQRADKQADKRARERAKEFTALFKLPKAEHPARLAALAKRLDEDPDALRDAFAEFTAVEETIGESCAVDAWPDPVNAKALLDDVLAQLRRYLVIHDDDAAVIYALAVLFAWCHDIATHSPLLVVQGADTETAKSTTCQVHALLTPRSRMIVKPTGPALFRFVDHEHPTLYIDNADKLLARDRDLADIVNSSWTRGVYIPRVVKGQVVEFDPFCFKVINGIDLLPHLDPATRTRCIVTEMLPKLPGERVVDFKHAASDERFVTLRRQAARWSGDNMTAVKDATPAMPEGFNNRLAMNYVLFFAIADLAGGDWPKKARAAAVKLSREHDAPSMGRRLLAIFYELFVRHGRLLLSEQVEKVLPAFGDEWANYKDKGRPINKWEVAVLLRPFKIKPDVIHPRGHPPDRGYDAAWFAIAFKFYLGKFLPGGRTVVRKRPRKKSRS